MQYRFYIYQERAMANFDKYDLSNYDFVREITQLTKWDIKIDRDREWFTVIREKFDGEITVTKTDYDTLMTFENSHIQYAVVIQRLCAGVWGEFWKGFFSYFDYKVDRDKCRLTFSPTVWDAYSPVFDQLDVERNVLAAGTGEDIFMDSYTWPVEMVVVNSSIPYPGVAVWSEIPTDPGSNYYLYSQISVFSYYFPISPGSWLTMYDVEQVYKRDIGYSNSAGVPPDANPQWSGETLLEPGLWKWSKPYLDGVYQVYSNVITSDTITEVLQTASNVMVVLHDTRLLKDVIDYFAIFFNLTYVSNFFNNTPCPMGGDSLSLTSLQQISNLRDATEQATKGIMTLKELLEWIRGLNVYPYIDSNGDFRLEHRRYFDYGLSYAYTHAIELDVTATWPDNTLHLNQYEWSKPELFRYEKLTFEHSFFPDWVDSKIEYKQFSIEGNETSETNVDWGTDIVSMYDGRDELPRKGWVLLDVYWAGSGVLFKKVRNTVGAISGVSMQNARFSSANILRDWWTYGRLLPEGYVNGALTTFDTIEKLRKQVTLSFPQCCTAIDYNGLFRTELGDGIIDSAIYESSTGMLKINLIYE